MFGIIVAGRLVQTDMQQVGETQFLFNISEAENINHIVIFMTGVAPLPDTMGAAVYFCWPNVSGPSWQLLGVICNSKPSAIFKVANLKKDSVLEVNSHPFGQLSPSQHQTHMAQIGLSVEPLIQLQQMTPAVNTNPSAINTFVEYSQKMVESLFNYAASFGVTQQQMTPNPSETFVPISTLKNWYDMFQRRLQQNPYFWKS